MNEPEPARPAYVPLDQCEICRELEEVETSFSKYGWDDMDRPLPPAAARLVPVPSGGTANSDRHQVKQCPVCGLYYDYSTSYEYLVNGSEDEETLRRLAPAEARDFLDGVAYAALMDQLRAELTAGPPLARRYAAKALAAHHLERGETAAAGEFAASADPEAARGALLYFRHTASAGQRVADIGRLAPVFTAQAASADPEVADVAQGVLYWLKNHAGRR